MERIEIRFEDEQTASMFYLAAADMPEFEVCPGGFLQSEDLVGYNEIKAKGRSVFITASVPPGIGSELTMLDRMNKVGNGISPKCIRIAKSILSEAGIDGETVEVRAAPCVLLRRFLGISTVLIFVLLLVLAVVAYLHARR